MRSDSRPASVTVCPVGAAARGLALSAVARLSSVVVLLALGRSALAQSHLQPNGEGARGEAALIDAIRRKEYEFGAVRGEAGVWSAPNRGQDLRIRVTADGIQVFPRSVPQDGGGAPWCLGIRSARILRGEVDDSLAPARVQADGARISLDHGRLIEWFVNRPEGLEQGWTILDRPSGSGPLRLVVRLSGGFSARVEEEGTSAILEHEGVALPYRDLRAWDACGRPLPVRLAATHAGLEVVCDDVGATYPLTIDPTLVQTIDGDKTFAYFGEAVTSAGDVNGDGFDDVLVGAPSYDNGETDEGRAYLFLGSASGLVTPPAWIAESDQAGARFGAAVAAAGNVVGDGHGDWMVGAPNLDDAGTDEGGVFVYEGSAGTLSTTPAWTAVSDNDFAQFGISLTAAGDVDGNGFEAIAIGSNRYDTMSGDTGAVFLYESSAAGLGSNGTPSNADWVAFDVVGAGFGHSVSAADFDGDDYRDLIIGAPGLSAPEFLEGRAYAYMGSPGGLATSPAWTAESDQSGAELGFCVSSAGDVDGDGFEDAIVGAPNYDNGELDEGRAYVYRGSSGGLSSTASWISESDQAGTGLGTRYGLSVAGTGDCNGDGYDDLVVGAQLYDNGQQDEGSAFFFEGSPVGPRPSLFVESDQVAAHLGFSVAGAGDVNGDGVDDVLVGAFDYNVVENEGRVYLYAGDPPTTWTGLTSSDWTDASNWTDGVPDSGTVAIIPDDATTPNSPRITGSTEACAGLVIETGGTLELLDGAATLQVFGNVTVAGSGLVVGGLGSLVFTESAVLSGTGTIEVAVTLNDDLEFVGGPLTIDDVLLGIGVDPNLSDLFVHADSTLLVTDGIDLTGSLTVDGDLFFGPELEVGGQFDSSVSGSVNGGEMRVRGPVLSGGILVVVTLVVGDGASGRLAGPPSISVVLEQPFDHDLIVQGASGPVVTLDAVVTDMGSVTLESGQVEIVEDSSAAIVKVGASATLEVAGWTLAIPDVLEVSGSVLVGPGGELVLGADPITDLATIKCGGMLSLVGEPMMPAILRCDEPGGFKLVFDQGCAAVLEARYFEITNISVDGLQIPAEVDLDLHSGAFDLPQDDGVFLDLERSAPTKFLYLAFHNSAGASNVRNVHVSGVNPITFVNWWGLLGGEDFDADDGEPGGPELVLWTSRKRVR